MTFPPLFLRLVVNGRGLWLPVFLLWLVLAVLGVLLLPVALLAALVLWPAGYGRALLLGGPRLAQVICAIRGLRVDVSGPDGEGVLIEFR